MEINHDNSMFKSAEEFRKLPEKEKKQLFTEALEESKLESMIEIEKKLPDMHKYCQLITGMRFSPDAEDLMEKMFLLHQLG